MRIILIIILFLFSFTSSIYAQGTWEHITSVNGDSLLYISDLAIDINGNIWLCSLSGTFCFDGERWSDYSSEVGMPHTVVCTDDGDVWFCDYSKLIKFDGISWQHYYPDQNLPTMLDIAVDSSDNVWCPLYDAGVVCFDGTNWTKYTVADGLANNRVTRIIAGPDGSVWCRYGYPGDLSDSPFCAGISTLTESGWVTYDESDGLTSNQVFDIVVRPDGDVFVSYGRTISGEYSGGYIPGISRFDGTEWVSSSETLNGKFFLDQTGELYIVTLFWNPLGFPPDEIDYYRDGEWIKAAEHPGFSTSIDMVKDLKGRYWVENGDYGLWMYNIVTGVQDRAIHEGINASVYPNPFNNETTIQFIVTRPSIIDMSIYNILGQNIKQLTHGLYIEGTHSVTLSGINLSSGQYFIRINADDTCQVLKISLIK